MRCEASDGEDWLCHLGRGVSAAVTHAASKEDSPWPCPRYVSGELSCSRIAALYRQRPCWLDSSFDERVG